MQDDETPRRTVAHTVGQALDMLSMEEIAARIALLTAEIERLDAAKAAKKAALDRADSVFRL